MGQAGTVAQLLHKAQLMIEAWVYKTEKFWKNNFKKKKR